MYIVLSICAIVTSTLAVKFQLLNKENGPIWVGIQGNPGKDNLNNGGIILGIGERVSIYAADDWAGRFWARTWCNPTTKHCDTGSCGDKVECNGAGGAPPVSLAEITLKGTNGLDYYDISLVDGFNIMIAIEPLGGQGDNEPYSCKKSACQKKLNDICPDKLKVRNSVAVIACNSACNAFNTDQYCCRGAYGTPDTCKSSEWPVDYPSFFKSNCPDAYSYAYDDQKSTFTCKAPAYLITFGA